MSHSRLSKILNHVNKGQGLRGCLGCSAQFLVDVPQFLADVSVCLVSATSGIQECLPSSHGSTAWADGTCAHSCALVVGGTFEEEDPEIVDGAQPRHLCFEEQILQAEVELVQGPKWVSSCEAPLCRVVGLQVTGLDRAVFAIVLERLSIFAVRLR